MLHRFENLVLTCADFPKTQQKGDKSMTRKPKISRGYVQMLETAMHMGPQALRIQSGWNCPPSMHQPLMTISLPASGYRGQRSEYMSHLTGRVFNAWTNPMHEDHWVSRKRGKELGYHPEVICSPLNMRHLEETENGAKGKGGDLTPMDAAIKLGAHWDHVELVEEDYDEVVERLGRLQCVVNAEWSLAWRGILPTKVDVAKELARQNGKEWGQWLISVDDQGLPPPEWRVRSEQFPRYPNWIEYEKAYFWGRCSCGKITRRFGSRSIFCSVGCWDKHHA